MSLPGSRAAIGAPVAIPAPGMGGRSIVTRACGHAPWPARACPSAPHPPVRGAPEGHWARVTWVARGRARWGAARRGTA
jgi:hypothetical protein